MESTAFEFSAEGSIPFTRSNFTGNFYQLTGTVIFFPKRLL